MLSDNRDSRDSFTFSFLIWMSFVSFSCLIALVRISHSMWNGSSKCGNPCVDLREKHFRFFFLEYDISCELVIHD